MIKKIGKEDIEFQLFQDFWKLRQASYEPKTEEEFKAVVKLIEDAMKPYEKTQLEWFARSLFMLHAEDCERRFKNGKSD